jgi:hypothetical protein
MSPAPVTAVPSMPAGISSTTSYLNSLIASQYEVSFPAVYALISFRAVSQGPVLLLPVVVVVC